jgi:hypothetical protein
MKFQKVVPFLLILFSIFVLATETNAQSECKRKLDDYNGRDPFPTGQIGDYGTCLDNLVTYYKGLKISERNLDTQIRNVENEIATNQSNLESARDSTGKERYKALIQTLTSKKDSLNAEKSKLDSNAYKVTLNDSFQTIIKYYRSIDDPKSADWERKFNAFKQLG